MIITAGGIDTHIHFICPQQIETALYSGVTTLIGGGTGPADGTNATHCNPGVESGTNVRIGGRISRLIWVSGKGNCSTMNH